MGFKYLLMINWKFETLVKIVAERIEADNVLVDLMIVDSMVVDQTEAIIMMGNKMVIEKLS
jgi:hypothetical protein